MISFLELATFKIIIIIFFFLKNFSKIIDFVIKIVVFDLFTALIYLVLVKFCVVANLDLLVIIDRILILKFLRLVS